MVTAPTLLSMSDKQMVLETIESLPDTASFEQIREELEVIAELKKGLEASEAGKVTPHEEVKDIVQSWFTK